MKPSLGVIAGNSHQIFTLKFCPFHSGRVDRHTFAVHMNDSDKYAQVLYVTMYYCRHYDYTLQSVSE